MAICFYKLYFRYLFSISMDSMIMVRTSYCPHSSFGLASPAQPSTSSEFQEQAGPGGAHTVFNCATLSFLLTRDYCNIDCEEPLHCRLLSFPLGAEIGK